MPLQMTMKRTKIMILKTNSPFNPPYRLIPFLLSRIFNNFLSRSVFLFQYISIDTIWNRSYLDPKAVLWDASCGLHQARRREAGRSPWDSRTNDGEMVVETSSICWYRTNWTRNIQKSDVKKCKCVKWRFWRRWRKNFRHSAISATSVTLYLRESYTSWHYNIKQPELF